MRGEVISPFHDKYHFNILYKEGDVVDFDTERMNDLIDRKLCKKLEEVGAKPTPRNKGNKTKLSDVLKDDNPIDAKLQSEKAAEAIIASAQEKK